MDQRRTRNRAALSSDEQEQLLQDTSILGPMPRRLTSRC
jgi:hypothetical protein